VTQGWSKIRRFLLVKTRPGYVKTSAGLRQGECGRCAACCKIFLHCPYLVDNTCRIYETRFEQCRAFPIDPKDIELIRRMGGACGFTFRNGRE